MFSESTDVSTAAEDNKDAAGAEFGAKKITLFQSVCLLLNNITGAAMVLYPGLYQQAGWLLPTMCMLLCALLSGIAGLSLIKSMQMIPYNERFQQRYEFTNVAMIYFSYRQYQIFFFFFILSMFASVVPLIIQTAQVMDFVLVELFGKSCALQFYPTFTGICSTVSSGGTASASMEAATDAFGSNSTVLTLGLIVLAILCIPVSLYNLDDNMKIQIGATFSMVALVIIWVVYFCSYTATGLMTASLPVVGTDMSKILGIVVFNYAFVTSIPSWVNEKAAATPVTASIWISLGSATLITLIIGIFGALAYVPFFESGNTILSELNASSSGFIRATYFLFPMVVNLTSIPITCIIIRYNLLSNQLMSKRWANFLSGVLPWLITIPFYGGKGFNEFITWTGVTINGVVNFLIPMYLYILAQRKYGTQSTYLGPNPNRLIHGNELEAEIYGDGALNDASSSSSSAQYIPVGRSKFTPSSASSLSSSSSSSSSSLSSPLADASDVENMVAAQTADFVDPLHAISNESDDIVRSAFNIAAQNRCCCGALPRCGRVALAQIVMGVFFTLLATAIIIDIVYVAQGKSIG